MNFSNNTFASGPYGSAGALIAIQRTRTVSLSLVELECDPQTVIEIENPRRTDSIFYPRNWTTRAIEPIAARIRLVQCVTWNAARRVLGVQFDGTLQAGAAYRLACALIPFESTIYGLGVLDGSRDEPAREAIIRDIAKPTRATDLQGGQLDAYQAVNGDLAATTGAAGLHERIVRIVETTAGELAHDQTYGVLWREKGLVAVDLLQRAQSRLLAQIRRQPDVTSVSVEVGKVATVPGMVAVRVQASTADGSVTVATAMARP